MLVGRHGELALLERALTDAAEGNRRTVVVHGEAGVGKTRLLEEFGRSARQLGARLLVGRCSEAAELPALWPWSQILDGYLDAVDEHTVDTMLRSYGSPIALALPGLRARMDEEGPEYLEPVHARFRAFDSLARFMATAAKSQPLVLELEDLHAADAASLRVLELLAYAPNDARLLVVTSYRNCDLADVDRLATTLTALRGSSGYQEIALGPLGRGDSRTLVELATGGELPDLLTEPVLDRAGGNPLFLIELARAYGTTPQAGVAASGVPLGPEPELPARIRDLIDQRLDQLPDGTLRTLVVAAAIGREFDLGELERATGEPARSVAGAVDDALQRRLLVEPVRKLGRYWFSHALVRDRLYERQGTLERSQLHRRIAVAFEALHATELDRYLPEIADHHARGAFGGDVEHALTWTVRAAEGALARNAHEEAVRRFGQALSVWALGSARDEAQRCSILVGLGAAQLDSGDVAGADEHIAQATTLARVLCRAGDRHAPELLARAALDRFRGWAVYGRFDETMARLLAESAAGLDADSPLRARVLARLAIAYYWASEKPQCEELSREAVESARRSGDEDALGHALYARHYVILGENDLAEQLAIAEELVTLGERCRKVEVALGGRLWRMIDRLGLDEVAQARVDLRSYRSVAEGLGVPALRANAALADATFATLEGRLAEAEAQAASAFELGRRANSANAEQYFGIQMMMIARLTGREAELIDGMRAFVERLPAIPAWRAALAAVCARTGREAEARRELDAIAADNFVAVRRDVNFLVASALIAETCIRLRERVLGRTLYRMLLPYSDRGIVIANVAGYLGVVAHYLGELAALNGDVESADRWLGDALTSYEAAGARPFVAETLVSRAAAWIEARGRVPHDRMVAARGMLERACTLAAEIGMPSCAERARALQAALAGDPPNATRPLVGAEDQRGYVLRQEREFWVVGSEGALVRLPDSKGLRYLAELLRAPGRDLHVLDLTGASAGPAAPSRRDISVHADRTDAEPLLDARARKEYRERRADLREELDAAEAANDTARAALIRAELDRIAEELVRALGLGGRDRRAASAAERARVNVTRSIHSVVDKLLSSHPRLGRHLEASITTGRFCRYDPSPDDEVRWNF